MEENKEIMQNETEFEEGTEANVEESGKGIGTVAKVGIGALIGIAAYKGVGFAKEKYKNWKESRKAKAEVVPDVDVEVAEESEE